MSKINILPLNIFTRVFFLFEHKHVVVEKLLESFVGVVDAELFKGVVFKDLETGDIQNANEGSVVVASLQSLVDLVDNGAKRALVQALRKRLQGILNLLGISGLVHPLATSLDARAKETLDKLLRVDAKEVTYSLGLGDIENPSLVGALRTKLNVANVENGRHDAEDFVLLVRREPHDSERVEKTLEF